MTVQRILLYAGVIAAALFVLSSAALYSFGHFKKRALGPPSTALPVSPDGTMIDRIVAALLAPHPGKSGIALLDDNLAAFATRAVTAREAGRSIDLQYYIWHGDKTGNLLLRELLQAADRGVRVRLLIDDIGTQGKDRSLLALDQHPLIEVRFFNPGRNRDGIWARAVELLLRARSMNRRMHNKAWIVDGRVAIVGGRNIGDEYFDAAGLVNFVDADLMLIGPAVAQASAIFDEFWNSRAVIPIAALHPHQAAASSESLRRQLDARAEQARASPWARALLGPEGLAARLSRRQALSWSDDVRVVSDPPEKASPIATRQSRERWLLHELQPLILQAQRQALLISPYFVPGKDGTLWLIERVSDGIDIQVLTNSLAATDVALVHAGYSRYRVPLLAGGIRIHEMKAQPGTHMSLLGSSRASLHTKAMIVDGQRGFVGSYNIDPRSTQLNTEMGVIFDSEALAARLREQFTDSSSLAAAYRLELRDEGLRWVEREADRVKVWTREPQAGIWRRGLIAIMRWLPIESQL